MISTVHLKSTRPYVDLSYKFAIFDWSKMRVKVIENSPILQNILQYVRYHSSSNLDPIFSVVQKIWAFKVRSFQVYLIKCLFFGKFDFES